MRGCVACRNSANHELPRTEWTEIPVPTIISEETFALANEAVVKPTRSIPRDPSRLLTTIELERAILARANVDRPRRRGIQSFALMLIRKNAFLDRLSSTGPA